MPEQHYNEGVVIGGNATVSGPVAAGYRARAEQHQGRPDAFRRELDQLRELVRAHSEVLRELDRVEDDLDEVDQEFAQPRPDTDRIRNTLNRLAGRVTAVAAVAAGVESLRQVLGG